MEIRGKGFSILSLVTARNEPRNRKESQKNDKTVHPAKAALRSHSCHLEPLNKELMPRTPENIFAAHSLTGHNRKHTGVTQNIPSKWSRAIFTVIKLICHFLWQCLLCVFISDHLNIWIRESRCFLNTWRLLLLLFLIQFSALLIHL